MMRAIMLIDDDADTRMTIRDFLTARGFVVHAAREGQHALRMLAKMDPPAMILLDYKMPVMDGKQLLPPLRRIPTLQGIPAVNLPAAPREWARALLVVEQGL